MNSVGIRLCSVLLSSYTSICITKSRDLIMAMTSEQSTGIAT